MNNVFTKSTVLLALLAILLGGGITSCKDDGDSGEVQPGYVGKIYSAKDGKSYLKIDTKDTATYCVWEEGSGAQASARVAATGKYVAHKGEYIITTEYTEKMFFFEVEWTDSEGNDCYYVISADVTNDDVFDNFKINGNDMDFVMVSADPTDPDNVDDVIIDDSSDDSSDGDDNSDSDDEEDDVTISENLVAIPAASIDGTETWTPESNVFVSGRKLEISAFYMSDHPVTKAEYMDIIGDDPSHISSYDKDGNELTGSASGNNPVTSVIWYEAIVYCNRLSIRKGLTPCYAINGSTDPTAWGKIPGGEGLNNDKWNTVTCDFKANGYRLPTEAEWEWAARGGENYTYAGSDDIDDVAWCRENTNDTGSRTVKSKRANGYGLYDMSGNVLEWCWDRCDDDIISSSTPDTGASSGSYRCQRGGSWFLNYFSCAINYRYNYAGSYNRNGDYGFRVVRTAK